jgi:ubiquinone/menaquinone biosynthesis C-methylase UbiE
MNIQKNKRYWEKIAKIYHANVGEKGDIRHEIIINPVVFEFLGDLTGKTVLDAACGNGYLSRRLAKSATKVVGVDLTEELIEFAKQKDNPKNLEFFVGTLERLQFQNQTFDAILCNMALMDIERLDVVIGELSRVLKTGGRMVISLIHPCFENPPRTYSIYEERKGKKIRIGTLVQKYFIKGLVVDERNVVDNGEFYQHYHYIISDYLNLFSKSNLFLKEVSEPNGYKICKSVDQDGGMNEDTPTFIIFKLEKLR